MRSRFLSAPISAEVSGSRTHQERLTPLTGFEVRAPHRGRFSSSGLPRANGKFTVFAGPTHPDAAPTSRGLQALSSTRRRNCPTTTISGITSPNRSNTAFIRGVASTGLATTA